MIIDKYVKSVFKKYLEDDGFSKNDINNMLEYCVLEIDDIVEEINDLIIRKIEEIVDEKCDYNSRDELIKPSDRFDDEF